MPDDNNDLCCLFFCFAKNTAEFSWTLFLFFRLV